MSLTTALIKKLQSYKIINENLKLNVRFQSKLNNNPELTQLILINTSFLHYSASIKARLHCLLTNITVQPTCKSCNGITEMRLNGKYRYTFPTFCSQKCVSMDVTTKKKRAKTNLEKYGHTNVLQNDEIKDKSKQTNMERYGVDNPLKSEAIREKIKQTNLERHGVDNPMKNDEIKDKSKQTNMERYGVDNPLKLEAVREKIKQTNSERYGHVNIFGSEEGKIKRKEGMLMKYGVEYPLQHTALRKNMLKSMITKHKEFEYIQEIQTYHQLKIDPNTIEKLSNKKWMTNQHNVLKKTFNKIAEELSVSSSMVSLNMKQHDIASLYFSRSQGEREMFDYIDSIVDIEVIANTKQLIPPHEIDIYVPSKNIAIEYNGIFWHSEMNGKDKKYHLSKTNHCKDKGIRLIHITDTEWLTKNEIVKSRLSSVMGKNKTIYARKTKIVSMSSSEGSRFFDSTHIQGNAAASVTYGLEYENNIVASMSFGKSRFSKKYQWELIRYSNDIFTSVVGGASRLLKHFIRNNNPTSIVTYSDKRWNTGNLYNLLGFTFMHSAKPNYYYFNPRDTTKLYHRTKFQKHKLSTILTKFDPALTEWQNMVNNGYDRIWDCGNDVYTLSISQI